MKTLRILAGALFILSLTVFVATTFIRQGLLSEKTWLVAIEQSNVTQQLEDFLVATLTRKVGAAGAEKARQNMDLGELRRLVESSVGSTMAFIRSEQNQLVFDFGKAGKFDVTAGAAANPQLGLVLTGVRVGYKVLTGAWIISGIVAVVSLFGVYAAGEAKRRWRPLAKLVLGGAAMTLISAGVVWFLGSKLAGAARLPIDVAGEKVYFDLSNLISAVLLRLVSPIVVAGVGLAVVGIIALVIARREPKTTVAATVPNKQKKINKKTVLAAVAVIIVLGGVGFYWKNRWTTYRSEEFGYRISLPPGWTVDDSASSGTNRETMVIHPDKLAFVTIKAIKDDTLTAPGALEAALKERVAGFEQQPGMTVTKSTADVQGDTGGYIIRGTERVQGQAWNFHEQALLFRSGKVLIFHGAADPSLGMDYFKTLTRIIESFQVEN